MPIQIITSKANEETIEKAAEDLKGYVKVVIDIEQGILAAGGQKHVDAEQILLEYGCKQKNLWGGGIDLDTNEIDYDSMINIRPSQNNTSREVLDPKTREIMLKIIRKLLK